MLVLLLSGLNATVFEGAPEESWRKRLPTIFLDVARFAVIGVGLALMLSYIWGVRIGGLFTALGVTSVVIGLMLQNSVGQIVSGLFMLFEQPFRIDDWLDTGTAQGRVVEVNWRAVHIDTGSGMRIMPNSMLATTSFTNLSRPPGTHKLAMTTTFSSADPPDQVCAMLSRVARALPQLKAGSVPRSVPVGAAEYRTIDRAELARRRRRREGDISALDLVCRTTGEPAPRRRRRRLLDDGTSGARVAHRGGAGIAAQRSSDQQSLHSCARIVRYGADEIVEYAGQVPAGMTFLVVRAGTADRDG